jgi:hypothetical protein
VGFVWVPTGVSFLLFSSSMVAVVAHVLRVVLSVCMRAVKDLASHSARVLAGWLLQFLRGLLLCQVLVSLCCGYLFREICHIFEIRVDELPGRIDLHLRLLKTLACMEKLLQLMQTIDPRLLREHRNNGLLRWLNILR